MHNENDLMLADAQTGLYAALALSIVTFGMALLQRRKAATVMAVLSGASAVIGLRRQLLPWWR